MSTKSKQVRRSKERQAEAEWVESYQSQIGADAVIRNRSGVEIKPLYGPGDWSEQSNLKDLGFPGQLPFTRGIYPTMHRGRRWSQRQLIGLGTPKDYNARVTRLLESGSTAISLLPCNSVFRGVDCDEVSTALLGTCGTVINTTQHMQGCLDGVAIDRISTAMNDPTPFTLLAFLLSVANRQNVAWDKLTGTSNQSDYISHYVANHMFYRLSLPGARRLLVDHIAFCEQRLPKWNYLSVVGQHMQQAGATPAQAMAFALCTAIQYVEDCCARGMRAEQVLKRCTFFFDISISFFEEIAKFRAGRRLWARLVEERFNVTDAKLRRFKFHAQTSGADLTRQQPQNNIARVTVQALAGIFGGLQSMHTDGYDEAISCPTIESARIAVATQNILRDEAHLCDVIDPLGGSYYVETLTDQMEAEIVANIEQIDAVGGMYRAVESGVVQSAIGESAERFQNRIESGEQRVVGVNSYVESDEEPEPSPYRPDKAAMEQLVEDFRAFKAQRSEHAVRFSINALSNAARSADENVFAAVVSAAEVGVTHGEIVAVLREELGFGHPLIV